MPAISAMPPALSRMDHAWSEQVRKGERRGPQLKGHDFIAPVNE